MVIDKFMIFTLMVRLCVKYSSYIYVPISINSYLVGKFLRNIVLLSESSPYQTKYDAVNVSVCEYFGEICECNDDVAVKKHSLIFII